MPSHFLKVEALAIFFFVVVAHTSALLNSSCTVSE